MFVTIMMIYVLLSFLLAVSLLCGSDQLRQIQAGVFFGFSLGCALILIVEGI